MTTRSAMLIASAILIFSVQGFAQLVDNRCQMSYRSRVIGGTNSERAPWMAYLLRNGDFVGGGSLIAYRFVLTAAHCTQANDTLYVRLGELDSATNSDGPTEDFRVIQIFTHENYVNHMSHDIALLKLDRAVVYSANIRPICILLDTKLRSKINSIQEFTLTGWGTTADKMPTRLQRLTVRRSSEYWCNGRSERFCCRSPSQFVCFGDSGSPLVATFPYKNKNITVQFGIASSASGDCDGYGIYTDVMHYSYWLVTVMRRHWSNN